MIYEREILKNQQYWQAVLGDKICKKLLENRTCEVGNQLEIAREDVSRLEDFYNNLFQKNESWDEYVPSGTFGNFYGFFGKIAVESAGRNEMIVRNNLREIILSNYYRSVMRIPMRVLIRDIHSCKEKGMLQGMNPEEEYWDYQDKFLKNPYYIQKLCRQYPEMKRLLLLRAVTVNQQIRRISERISIDSGILNRQLFPGNPFKSICKIECGLSDPHNGGQTVAKLYLDNHEMLIYKPRCLEKDKLFIELYRLVCDKMGLSFRDIQILARKEYSWEACFVQSSCREQEELKRYFIRMGILLFLCWILGVRDMHGENIIADGEYPIPVDLETLPGYFEYFDYENPDQKIVEELRHSVLSVGILPVPVWESDGKGIVLNAFNNGQTVKMPFSTPIINEPESSNIHFAYQNVVKKIPNSLPVYQGQEANPAFYADELMKGFRYAYLFFLQNKDDLLMEYATLLSGKSRCLIRHTQQYFMYLQTSFYPEFLECGERRKLFLHVLDKDQENDELAARERDSLYQLDIPVFYRKEHWKQQRKIEMLGEDNLERQLALIALSLGQLEKRSFVTEKEKFQCDIQKIGSRKERTAIQIHRISNELCRMSLITSGNDIGFYGCGIEESGNFQLNSMGVNLYGGISGIVVFLAAVLQEYPVEKYRRVFELSLKKMICYTEEVTEGIREAESGNVGTFTGESAVVFTYCLLYKISRKPEFLMWAELHARIVEKLYRTGKSMDYLSGLAGAVTVFGQLYSYTKRQHYVEIAVQMGEKIWECCEIMDSGAGWRAVESIMPLVGMAHGNSGLIMAFTILWKLTRYEKYEERIEKLGIYESNLYEGQNWKDLRHQGGIRLCNNAWCHGAAGILISRQRLKQSGFREKTGWIERDIERCRHIFLENIEPDEVCLCHGLAGNYLVLGQYLQWRDDGELRQEYEALGERILERLEQNKISLRERYNLGLMTGISGIGLALLQKTPDLGLLG